MSQLLKVVMCVIAGIALLGAGRAQAGEVDVLLDILVKKGVLTTTEANIVRDETKQAVAAELQSKKSYAVPEWAQKTKVKGDMRLRYEMRSKKNSTDRHRGRYRFRLGVESQITKKVTVAGGLATGGTDPRSTNQTFGNNFETPDIRMDYAYVKYTPLLSLELYGGQLDQKPVLWTISDLLWDSDIRPQGASLAYSRDFSDNISAFFNGGFWVLDESSSESSDPYLKYLQPGLVFGFDHGIKLKTAVTYYGFENTQQTTLDNSAGTNTLDVNGGLATSFRSVNPAVELSVVEPFEAFLPYAAVFGEYITNLDDDHVTETDGWLAGIKFGDKKVSNPGQWQFKYMYRHLEKDAFPDSYPDSDAYGGETNVKGHEWAMEYGLATNVVLGLDIYRTDVIKGADRPETLVQTDVAIKF